MNAPSIRCDIVYLKHKYHYICNKYENSILV